MEHRSVLLEESIRALEIRPDGIYVDATLGRGGHSSVILSRLTTGHLYCFDLDLEALEESRERLKAISDQFTLIHANYAEMQQKLAEQGIEEVDGILMDLGVSSPQFDDPERGFSYRYDTRLDMRMDRTQTLDAYHIVNEYEYSDLVRILSRYGEEPFARQIARKIESRRASKPIETTGELVDIIKEALPAKALKAKGHPAKQTFQALRIEVNGELTSLQTALDAGLKLLSPGGRMAVISFHSLEDEIVKHTFRKASTLEGELRKLPLKEAEMPKAEYSMVTRKPITASQEELTENRRAHSARLRVIERRKQI